MRMKYLALSTILTTAFSAAASAQTPTLDEANDFLQGAAEESRMKLSDMTFEEFKATVFREPDGGKFIVNGDIAIPNEKQLLEFFNANVRNQPVPPSGTVDELIVHVVGGLDAVWSQSEKRSISYCVSPDFASRHAEVVAAMRNAAQAWEAVANVDFVYRPEEDVACNAFNTGVTFDVRPVGFGQYLARAFFPHEGRAGRNVLIDTSSFALDPNGALTLTGILRHELGHTLGFRHEHTRPDSGTCFEDDDWRPLTDYDGLSVMHYPQCNGLGDWTLRLTGFDKNGAACLYGAAQGFVVDASVCSGTVAAARTIESFSDQTIAEGEIVHFGPFDVEPGTEFRAEMTASGDAPGDPDLYVKFDALAALADFDCRPFLVGADEDCLVDAPNDAQAASVMIHGFDDGAYSLAVTFTPPD